MCSSDLYGAAMAVFGFSTNYALSFAALFVSGAMDNFSVVVRHSAVQIFTPDELRGRVSAVNRVFVDSSNKLGTVESSLVAGWVSPAFTMVLGGAVTVAVVLYARAKFKELRNLRSLTDTV